MHMGRSAMLQRISIVLVTLVLLALSGVFLSRSIMPRSGPTSAAPPQMTPDVKDLTAAGVVTPAVHDDLIVTLAPEWQTGPATVRDRLAAQSPAEVLLVAWQESDTFEGAPVRLTILRVPGNGLSLDRYVAGLAQTMASYDEVTVVSTEMTTTLRQDGLPAGVVHYRVADRVGEQIGYQAALFDPAGEKIVAVTMSAAAGRGDAEALFRAVVRQVRFP